jgi:hypothetical protein
MADVVAAQRRLAIQGFNPQAAHQGSHLASPNGAALLPQKTPQHASSRRWILQMQLVDPTHQGQRPVGDRPRVRVGRRPRQPKELTLPDDRQEMRAIAHGFALRKPALPSAPAKKMFSSARCPIFACSILRSGVSVGVFVPPNTSAAPTSNCCFHSVICVGWALNCAPIQPTPPAP